MYRLSHEVAFISTVDFITPPVDDPYWFGQIAAANALSDVYAMGGKPVTALNLVMFPSEKLDIGHLKDILRGGYDKVVEAGASMAGGHSIDDIEPKYGLSVTGVVHPEKIVTNCGARDGDALILTKPLGTGVLFNACRAKKFPYREIEKLLPLIASLNRKALETALKYDLHSCTDITGFGLAGHVLEMAKGSGMKIHLVYRDLPFYPGSLDMYRKGVTTKSNRPNRKLTKDSLEILADLSGAEEELLFDPQTSGGLLLSVPSAQANRLLDELHEGGISHAVRIGEVKGNREPGIRIL